MMMFHFSSGFLHNNGSDAAQADSADHASHQKPRRRHSWQRGSTLLPPPCIFRDELENGEERAWSTVCSIGAKCRVDPGTLLRVDSLGRSNFTDREGEVVSIPGQREGMIAVRFGEHVVDVFPGDLTYHADPSHAHGGAEWVAREVEQHSRLRRDAGAPGPGAGAGGQPATPPTSATHDGTSATPGSAGASIRSGPGGVSLVLPSMAEVRVSERAVPYDPYWAVHTLSGCCGGAPAATGALLSSGVPAGALPEPRLAARVDFEGGGWAVVFPSVPVPHPAGGAAARAFVVTAGAQCKADRSAAALPAPAAPPAAA